MKLADLQAVLIAAMKGEETSDKLLEQIIPQDKMSVNQQLQIYQNSRFETCYQHLKCVFSACEAFVGALFFKEMVREYVKRHWPKTSAIIHYGDDFSNFVHGFSPAKTLPYLAELAHFEWSMFQLQYIPLMQCHPLTQLTHLNQSQQQMILPVLRPHCLLHMQYPVDRLWQLSSDPEASCEIDLSEGPVNVLLFLMENNVHMVRPSELEWACLEAISQKKSIIALVEQLSCAFEEHEVTQVLSSFLVQPWTLGFVMDEGDKGDINDTSNV